MAEALATIRAARSSRGVSPVMVVGWLGGDAAKAAFYWGMDDRRRAKPEGGGAPPPVGKRTAEPLLLGAFMSVALDCVVMYYMFVLYPNAESKALVRWATNTRRSQ